MRHTAVCTVVFLALMFAVACEHEQQRAVPDPPPGQNHGHEKNRVFHVYIYTPDPNHLDQCSLDWPQATLWKSEQQTVDWVSDDRRAYTVYFGGPNGSPFVDSTFSVPANGDVPSKDLIKSGKYYEYGIKNATGGICKDPSDPGLYVK